MNKLLLTIATLFAYSGLFSQTWNTGTGAWISPLSKNIGIQKSLQVGDNVGTDTLWCNTDLNYFEGNVGIGTITPEAKLHVSSNDTTGIEIAHFENNLGTAIMTLHSHADSSALYGLQTEDFNSALGLSGTTGEVILLTGLGSVAIEIDTNNNVTIPDLAGSAQKLVTADAAGTMDTTAMIIGFTNDAFDNFYVAADSAGAGSNLIIGIESAHANPASTTGVASIAIGQGAQILDNAVGAIAIGFTAAANGDGIAIGLNTSSDNESVAIVASGGGSALGGSIAIGGAASASAGQIVFQTGNTAVSEVWFGSNSTVTDVSLNIGSANGTNIAGAILNINAARASGNATTGSYISFKTPDAGASGTVLQTLTEKVRITKGGDVLILNSANGLVLKDAAGTPHYWRVTISTLGVLTTTDLGTTPP